MAPAEALALFAVLGLMALALLMLLNPLARLLAIGAAALTVIYPFSKRWLSAPQLLLGAAFGWGIPMAFAAETEAVPRLAWLLWLVVVVWAVIYDTMYAMADREDDLRIGVRSTAILFGTADLFIIFLLQVVLVIGLLLAGREGGLGIWYQAGVAVGALLLASQLWTIRHREPAACLDAFRANQHFGAAIFAGILLDYTFRAAGLTPCGAGVWATVHRDRRGTPAAWKTPATASAVAPVVSTSSTSSTCRQPAAARASASAKAPRRLSRRRAAPRADCSGVWRIAAAEVRAQRPAPFLAQAAGDLLRLVEAPVGLPAPVQRHRDHRVGGLGQRRASARPAAGRGPGPPGPGARTWPPQSGGPPGIHM